MGADDPDGYVRSITVTGPDGKTRTYMNDAACVDAGNTWSPSYLDVRFTRVIEPGVYRYTISAVSTDCAGGSRQEITCIESFTVKREWRRAKEYRRHFLPHAPRGTGIPGAGMPMVLDDGT